MPAGDARGQWLLDFRRTNTESAFGPFAPSPSH